MSDLTVPDGESALSDGRIEFSLQTAPHQLTLTARFDNNAIVDGILAADSSLELLLELADILYE